MYLYFVRNKGSEGFLDKRISNHSYRVFHGFSEYVGRNEPGWVMPSPMNDSRDPLHVQRSGRFVPDVFGVNSLKFVISSRVKKQLEHLPGIEFNEVVFEHLVDQDIPVVGDFTSHGNEGRETLTAEEMSALPDVPEFHESIGKYYTIIFPSMRDVKDRYDDFQEFPAPDWGSFNNVRNISKTGNISKALFQDYAVFACGFGLTFSEDAFAAIAPFLDLDYYAIAVYDLDPEPRFNPFTNEWIEPSSK